jgi:hypothetical protein
MGNKNMGYHQMLQARKPYKDDFLGVHKKGFTTTTTCMSKEKYLQCCNPTQELLQIGKTKRIQLLKTLTSEEEKKAFTVQPTITVSSNYL